MDPDSAPAPPSDPKPSPINYILSFILVGLAWGFTTPFIRRAAVDFNKRQEAATAGKPAPITLQARIRRLITTVVNLLRTPAYLIPLVLNLTGSVWFFLLVGKHELSLTVPITNSMAFLFTVLGEWYVEGKMISARTWLGMAFVLAGIATCVMTKGGE